MAHLFSKDSRILSLHEPHPSMLDISNKYIKGFVNESEVIKEFKHKRYFYFRKAQLEKKELYIESNNRLYSLIPVIKEIFEDYRIIHIVRDGREVVRSGMNRKYYTNNDVFFKKRIMALDFKNDEYYSQWNEMSSFEKTCWWWQKKDSIIYSQVKNCEKARTYKYEELFFSNDAQLFEELIRFIGIDDVTSQKKYFLQNRNKKINKNNLNNFPKWNEWNDEQKNKFNLIAGEHMQEMGYTNFLDIK